LLEVQTNEIDVGLRAVVVDGAWQAQVFLSDSLANGAGYCTHLGQPDRFEDLLAEAKRWGDDLEVHTSGGKPCDSACYDCLKDYRNMHYHGLLDWRLGLDLLDILNGHNFDGSDRWTAISKTVTDRFSAELQFERETHAGRPVLVLDDMALVVVHPFEDARPDYLSEELAELKVDFAVKDKSVVFTDVFNLLRRPSWVYGRSFESL
jgi:hypothetical protein